MIQVRNEYLPFGRPNFSEEEIEAVTKVMRSGWIGMGAETIAFEEELSTYLKVPHVITVNSCTSALFLSLLVNGIGPGDEVICPSLTWCSTANVVLHLGAKVVFCDVDPESACVTPEEIVKKVTPNTKAVMVVHFGGLAVDVAAIRKVLPPHVVIVEDAAHALGSSFTDESMVGSSGNLTCFSFYANKNLSTAEGGAIALFDDKISERLRSLRQHGLASDAWKRFIQPQSDFTPAMLELGYKMNYTDLQACIGRVQLKRQSEFHDIRLKIAQEYYMRLSEKIPGIKFQTGILHSRHSRHLLTVQLPLESVTLSRNEVVSELRKRNIGASVHYCPVHILPFYLEFVKINNELSNTERLAQCIMTLPISASMTCDDVEYVTQHLIDIIK
jgi:dTDP-4-amino-4,6-dideoxygalactose transaminase